MESNRKIKITIILMSLLFLFVATIPILNYFNIWKFSEIYIIFENIANLLYLISGFLLVLGLWIAYHQLILLRQQVSNQLKNTEEQIKYMKEQLHHIKEDMRVRNDKIAVEKSVDYLHIFASDIIPMINKYNLKHKDRVELRISNWDPSESDYKLNIFELPDDERLKVLTELEKRRMHNLLDILNKLEFFSAGIMNGLGKEDVVYDPISNPFLRFVSREIVELSSQRYLGTPFTNTIELYKLWKKRKKADEESINIQMLEQMLSEKRKKLDELESKINPPTYIGG